MKTTIDTQTGKRFRYNGTCYVGTVQTVSRTTSRTFTYLHPDRLTPAMFTKLNGCPR